MSSPRSVHPSHSLPRTFAPRRNGRLSGAWQERVLATHARGLRCPPLRSHGWILNRALRASEAALALLPASAEMLGLARCSADKRCGQYRAWMALGGRSELE